MERRRVLRDEVLLVLGVSLGASAVYSVVTIIARLTADRPLSQQTATMNSSRAPGRPWLDLTLQLLDVLFAVVPALLAVHLLNRDPGEPRPDLGVDLRRPLFDLGTGAALAALIGVPGIGLYLAGRALDINTTVVPANLPDIWWAVPVLVLVAAANAILEEVVVIGYLVTRLRQLGWSAVVVVATSAVLRGSYHLYQGLGAFIGNGLMGVVFALFFLRTRRVMPLIVAHMVVDIVAFVGYTLFRSELT